MKKANDLVSVVVLTYNSSATIIETLDSIREQTYRNIELVITDDCSSDNTIELCNNWLQIYGERFNGYHVVETNRNTGTAGNENRGVNNSNGSWIKLIAGDDLLIPSAIEEFVVFSINHREANICVSDVEPFSTTNENLDSLKDIYDYYFKCAQEPYEKQYARVLRVGIIVGPGIFFSKELFNAVGGCYEEYPFSEEWAFYYKVLKAGYRIFALDKKLVKYRFTNSSVSHSEGKGLESYRCFISRYNFFFDYPYKDLIKERRYLAALDSILEFKTLKMCHKYNNRIFARIVRSIIMMLSPYMYYRKYEMRKIIGS